MNCNVNWFPYKKCVVNFISARSLNTLRFLSAVAACSLHLLRVLSSLWALFPLAALPLHVLHSLRSLCSLPTPSKCSLSTRCARPLVNPKIWESTPNPNLSPKKDLNQIKSRFSEGIWIKSNLKSNLCRSFRKYLKVSFLKAFVRHYHLFLFILT